MPTDKVDLGNLTKLGRAAASAERKLEVFPNHSTNLVVTATCHEFTCFCPLTHQPDFAKLVIRYKADSLVVESKSLKLYLESFRDTGIFHEHVAEDIATDIMTFVRPHWVEVTVHFNIRGGIALSATVFKER